MNPSTQTHIKWTLRSIFTDYKIFDKIKFSSHLTNIFYLQIGSLRMNLKIKIAW